MREHQDKIANFNKKNKTSFLNHFLQNLEFSVVHKYCQFKHFQNLFIFHTNEQLTVIFNLDSREKIFARFRAVVSKDRSEDLNPSVSPWKKNIETKTC